ncbi:MAG: pitrilysin family protein [Candidatus Gastranaerophilaceae bacterium]|jgi:predicted Zn-dependent peptidase
MQNIDIFKLSNGIKVILKENPNTPRIAINFFINTGIKNEPKAGIAALASRLLLQGTTSRTQEELSKEIDNYAINLTSDSKQDYSKINTVFLNEDLPKAIELFSDIINNSTFETFEKEMRKFKGEIGVELDSPKTKAIDNYVKNLYKGHPYGNSFTRVLEELENLTQEDTKNYYFSSLSPENIKITVVGDVDKNLIKTMLENNFGKIQPKTPSVIHLSQLKLDKTQTVKIEKDDAAQAQVIQGWIVPGILSEEYPALTILNTILGSSGLSSRLFVELRDKQGLAYVVRSSYDPLTLGGNFLVYIATEPKNIKTALDGFKTEIKKLQDTVVSEKELDSAKTNILGKRNFFHETNAQQAHYLGYYEVIGLGSSYDDEVIEKIKRVTADDVKNVAKKYLGENSVISLLAPQKELSQY